MLFNSHVEVICGYHQAIDVFYVRDPMHWAPSVLSSKMTFQRYELYGAVLAIIDEDSTTIINLAEENRNEECVALIDLAQAVQQRFFKMAKATTACQIAY